MTSFGAGMVTHPHRLPQQWGRNRVVAILESDHRGIGRHLAGDAEPGGVRDLGDRMQPESFLSEHLDRTAPGHPMLTIVDLAHELRTRRFDVAEGVVGLEQVGGGGHDIGFGELHGVLHPAFGGGVGRFAGEHADPVEPAEGDRVTVADWHPGHMSGGDGFLVVG